jgi:glycosyltransferase involved in cell wall biosynthesis
MSRLMGNFRYFREKIPEGLPVPQPPFQEPGLPYFCKSLSLMKIAINTRFTAYDYLEGYGYFTHAICRQLLQQNMEDQFLFLYDRPPGEDSFQAGNLQKIVMGPPARHPLLWKYWYDYKVPGYLKKAQSDVFLSPDGICSLRTKVPQVLVIHDLAFLHDADFLPAQQRWFYRHYTPRFIRKAAKIITVSEFSRKDIVAHYPAAERKIEVVYNGVDVRIKPLEWESREAVKQRFAEGKEYFLYIGSIHPRKNLINLLKAFSIFKKRQQTNMKLIIAGRLAWKNESFVQALSTFRFRKDVYLAGYLSRSDLISVLGAAYALVNPSLWEGFGMPLVEAMQSGVPVICSDTSVFPEIAGEAACYFNPLQPESIAEQLSHIFKNEEDRARMVDKGLRQATRYNWSEAGVKFREILNDAVSPEFNA